VINENYENQPCAAKTQSPRNAAFHKTVARQLREALSAQLAHRKTLRSNGQAKTRNNSANVTGIQHVWFLPTSSVLPSIKVW